jgi:hypothetical protein
VTESRPASPESGPAQSSLDTWQHLDISDARGDSPTLVELYTDDSWRPYSRSTFGVDELEPAELAEQRRYFARLVAETPATPRAALTWAELNGESAWDAPEQLPRGRARERELDAPEQLRLIRNDTAKIELTSLIHAAAAARAERGFHELELAAWLSARASAITTCRSVRAFRDAGCGAYLARPVSCRVRVCPDCERARAARLARRFAGLTLDMARPIFWTFTVPNVAPDRLELGVDWLLESFRRLRRRAIFRGGPCRKVGAPAPAGDRCLGHAPIAGGVYALEATWSAQRGDWHPHIHVLADAPYVRWAEMRDAWRAATCDAIRYLEQHGGRVKRCAHRADELGLAIGGCRGASVVWVEAVKGAPGSPERLAAVREVLKYTVGGLVKSDGSLAGASVDRLGDLLIALRNRRLIAGWGTWRNVTDADLDDEAPDVLRGDDVWPALRGLPVACPSCGREALWELPVDVPRRACYFARDGTLRWRPPPAARA